MKIWVDITLKRMVGWWVGDFLLANILGIRLLQEWGIPNQPNQYFMTDLVFFFKKCSFLDLWKIIMFGNNHTKQDDITGWWWMVAIDWYFPMNIGLECNHPNWRTHIFQRGGPTTKQDDISSTISCLMYNLNILPWSLVRKALWILPALKMCSLFFNGLVWREHLKNRTPWINSHEIWGWCPVIVSLEAIHWQKCVSLAAWPNVTVGLAGMVFSFPPCVLGDWSCKMHQSCHLYYHTFPYITITKKSRSPSRDVRWSPS